jgi:hypothetical protein
VTPDVWHHVAFSGNQSSGGTVYVDGAAVEMDRTIGAWPGPTDPIQTPSATQVIISGSYPAAPRYFKGQLNELRVWHEARTQAQIQANRSMSLNPLAPENSNLRGYWPFRDNLNDQVNGYISSPNPNPSSAPQLLAISDQDSPLTNTQKDSDGDGLGDICD